MVTYPTHTCGHSSYTPIVHTYVLMSSVCLSLCVMGCEWMMLLGVFNVFLPMMIHLTIGKDYQNVSMQYRTSIHISASALEYDHDQWLGGCSSSQMWTSDEWRIQRLDIAGISWSWYLFSSLYLSSVSYPVLFWPLAWRGIRDDALSALTGIPDCIFVHAAGFIGGAHSYDSALQMAIQAWEWPDPDSVHKRQKTEEHTVVAEWSSNSLAYVAA